MWVIAARSAVLSVITGGGKWVEIKVPALRWMAATLDGRVEASGAVFEAKFMLPWSFSEETAPYSSGEERIEDAFQARLAIVQHPASPIDFPLRS
jgi:hypothetical protein